MKSTDLTLHHAFICDDYRVEDNGKGLAIGIYGNTLLFSQAPTLFSCFVCFIATAEGNDWKHEIKIELLDIEGKVLDTAKGGMKMSIVGDKPPGPEEILIPIRMRPLKIEQDGEIVIKAKPPQSGRWKVIAKKNVRLAQIPQG